jgi:hypothetical protein
MEPNSNSADQQPASPPSQTTKSRELQQGLPAAWEHIVPAVVAMVVLFASLATTWSKLETILWAIVSFLLTQSLAFQVVASKEREMFQSRLDDALSDRQEKLNQIIKLTAQQPQAARYEVIETLRSFYKAMGAQDKFLQIHRDPILTTFAKEVMRRADDDLDQILSKGTYTMRVVTPSDDYVKRWYSLMESLDANSNAEFLTMSNIVIWSSDYFGKTPYGNLQSNSKMKIRRIFVVPSNTQLESDRALAIRLQDVLREYVEKIHPTEADPERPQQVETRVYISASADEYRAHFISGRDHHSSNFAIWRISDETKLVLTVDYLQDNGDTNFQVASITFGQSSFGLNLGLSSLDIADKEESFRRRWDSSSVIAVQKYLKMLANKIDPKPDAREEKDVPESTN